MFGRSPFPRPGLLALIAAVTLVPLAALAWFGSRWLEHDEDTQVGLHLDASADLVVASLDRSLVAAEQKLVAGATEWTAGALVLNINEDAVEVVPRERAAFLPAVAPRPEAPAAFFEQGEDAEYRRQDLGAAMAAYRRLAETTDPVIRAGALVRLAGVQVRYGLPEAALSTYASLLSLDDVQVGDVPVSLAARYSRCRILEAQQRRVDLKREGDALLRDLHAGRWPLTEPLYSLYVDDAGRWSGVGATARDEEAMAQAVALFYRRRAELRASGGGVRSGREEMAVRNRRYLVLWWSAGHRLLAVIADEGFVAREWLPPAQEIARLRGVALALVSPAPGGQRAEASLGAVAAVRSAANTNLPWDLSVTLAAPSGPLPSLVSRRRVFVAAFALLATMVLTAGYVVVRAVGREMAAVRQQSDFLAAVSHEFRTPLTTLRQFTERLRDHGRMADEDRKVCYDAQARATDRLTHLVESLLDFGRMEARAHPYSFESCDGCAVVREAVREFEPDAAAAGYQVQVVAPDAVAILADRQALKRAVSNLLENAVKYSPGEHVIGVGVRQEGETAVISVSDWGLGIPADEQPFVFAKFRRGADALTLGIKGTGLGLAMVSHIVAAHRGRVDLESEPGRGSTFTIRLPVTA